MEKTGMAALCKGLIIGVDKRWSRSLRQGGTGFKWFAAPVHTTAFTFGSVLQ
jgi:hypothetical protein